MTIDNLNNFNTYSFHTHRNFTYQWLISRVHPPNISMVNLNDPGVVPELPDWD